MVSLNRYMALLTRYLRPQRYRALLLALFILSVIGLQLINPQILRSFIDSALEGSPQKSLIRLAVLFLVVGLSNQLLAVASSYLGASVGWTATNLMRWDLFKHCLNLDMSFHHEHKPGELIERIDADVTYLSNFFSEFVIRVLGSILLSVGILILLFRENVWVGTALTLFSLAAFLILLYSRNLAVPATVVQREASSRLFGFLEEKLAGLEDIRTNAGGGYVLDRFYRTNHKFFHSSRKSWMLRSVLVLTLLTLFSLGEILAIGLGVLLLHKGLVTIGTVFLFYQYTGMLRTPLEQIARQLQDLQNATAGIRRADELLQLKSRLSFHPTSSIPEKALSVDFDKVSFSYHASTPVLRDVSFFLEPGSFTGLLGRTGSGKSTLARLLFRLYDPSHGVIRLGGVDIRQVDAENLRARVGMVTQEVQLFQASIRDNLTFFNQRVTDKEIHRVLDQLGLLDWIEQLPKGLETPLGSDGEGLSAGEAQLLAFARVFLKDPGLIILDEPSSRMDSATEHLLQSAMQGLMRGRTALVIAHRLSTVETANSIMVMEQGRLVEFGPRTDLLHDAASRYAGLLKTGLWNESQ